MVVFSREMVLVWTVSSWRCIVFHVHRVAQKKRFFRPPVLGPKGCNLCKTSDPNTKPHNQQNSDIIPNSLVTLTPKQLMTGRRSWNRCSNTARFQQKMYHTLKFWAFFFAIASWTNCWLFFWNHRCKSNDFMFHIFLIIDLLIKKITLGKDSPRGTEGRRTIVETNGWVAESGQNSTSTTRLHEKKHLNPGKSHRPKINVFFRQRAQMFSPYFCACFVDCEFILEQVLAFKMVLHFSFL